MLSNQYEIITNNGTRHILNTDEYILDYFIDKIRKQGGITLEGIESSELTFVSFSSIESIKQTGENVSVSSVLHYILPKKGEK